MLFLFKYAKINRMTRKIKENKGKKIATIVTFSILLIIFTAVLCFSSLIEQGVRKLLFRHNVLEDNASLRVHFIDVGQGDCIAINLPDGKIMLIDAGSNDYSKQVNNYLLSNVVNHRASKKLDYVVLTHSDADHIGGMSKILTSFKIGTVFRPAIASTVDDDYGVASCSSSSETYASVITRVKQLKSNGTNVVTSTRGLEIEGSGYTIQFLSPFTDTYITTNEYSPYILLTCFGKSFLFTGDATKENETELMTYESSLSVDVLKVAHHGSSTSTSREFMAYLSPEYAVISVGKDNSFGHPTSETLANIRSVVDSENILLTSVLNNISFVIGDGYEFSYLTGTIYTTINVNSELIIMIAVGVDAICGSIIIITCVRQKATKNGRKKS